MTDPPPNLHPDLPDDLAALAEAVLQDGHHHAGIRWAPARLDDGTPGIDAHHPDGFTVTYSFAEDGGLLAHRDVKGATITGRVVDGYTVGRLWSTPHGDAGMN